MKLIFLLIFLFVSIQSNFAQITSEWEVTNGTTSNDAIDFPTCSASDNSGNTYISGWSTRNEANGGHLLFLKKISSIGQLIWQKNFDVQQSFSSNSNSQITLDNQYNVILVAPDYYNAGLFITKLLPSGNTLWTDTLNPGTYYTVTRVITDNNNNIYIGASNADFVLIKYNQDGLLQYNLNIDGGLSIADVVVNISLDNNNNIILSGNRGSIPGDYSAIVYKYDADGNQIWNTVITHTNTTQIELRDHIILNDEIVVCGYFYNATDNYRGYLTKLNAAGAQGTVAVDPQISSAYFLVSALGSDLVVGVGDPQGFATVNSSIKRFTSSFSEVWNQALSSGGLLYQLLTNQNNDIYVLTEHGGSSNIKNTIYKYSSGGNLIWSLENDSSTYLSRSKLISISSNGNVRFTAPYFHSNNFPYNDYTDLKFFDINNNTGLLNWTYQYDGIVLNVDRATLMTKDSQGNIYIAGSFTAGWINKAVGIAKYDNMGNLLWLKKLDFSAGYNNSDEPLSITCDIQDNLIVAGYTTNTNRDFLLLKLNPLGNLIWQKIFNGTGNNSDQFNSVITDAASNIYAAGLSVRNFGGTNNLYVHQIYKYDANGTELWENWEYSNPTGTQKIILSPSQLMVYVACEYYGNASNPSDLGVFKLRADNGSYLHWISFNGTSANSNDRIKGIAIDIQENIYLNGNVNNSGLKAAVIKYDSTLTQVWASVYPQNSIGNQFYKDQNENLLVSLQSMSSDSAAIIKYSKNGSIIWTKKLIGSNNNLSNTFTRQLNDSVYAVVSMLENVGSISLNKIFIIDTSGLVLSQYTTSNTESYYLRDIQAIGNSLFTCGFYSELFNHFISHENYYLNKYIINIGNGNNSPPSLSSIQNDNACTTDAPLSIPFMVSDENISQVILTASSSDINVISNSAFNISGSGTQRNLTISFSGSNVGQTTISISATDSEGLITTTSFTVQVELCSGINNTYLNDINIYPNPVSNQFVVCMNRTIPDASVMLFDMIGQLVLQQPLNSAQNLIDVSHITAGSYKIVLKTRSENISEKIVEIMK
jgi:hypothetical protein